MTNSFGFTNSNNSVKRKSYRSFLGVDLSSAVTEVSDRRTPDAPNMIADESGFPQKRTGTKPLISLDNRINGIHYCEAAGDFIIHSGSKLYLTKLNGDEPTLLYSDCADSRSASFEENGSLYLLDGKRYLKYKDGKVSAVDKDAYVPTTQISAPPEGGGSGYEAVNLLSDYRINSFLGKAGVLVYQLDANEIDGIEKAEVKNSSGEWTAVSGYSCDKLTGRVTFASAPGAPLVSGEDNVRITFKKAVPEYKKRINECTVSARYGLGGDTRLFLTGGEERKNYDYFSASGNCEYFPDLNYSVVGADASKIMGYLHQFDSLVVVKENKAGDLGIYFRKAAEDDNGKTVFTVMPALSGSGAVSKYCFLDLPDDNVFLSEQGLMGLSCSSVTLQRTVQNRSGYINRVFTKEIELEGAYGCLAGSYYFIFINGTAYIADLRRKSDNMSGSYCYEWFYFTDIWARCALYNGGKLYLGTGSGEVRVFRDELEEGMDAYNDVTGSGEIPVKCRWTTKADSLSDSAVFKKICKKGTGVVIKPFANTGGTICYMSDYEEEAKDFSLSSVFDFNNVDFNDFSFGVSNTPYFVPAGRKKRKAKMWQMIIKNEEKSSAFGIYEIRVNFKDGAYIKR